MKRIAALVLLALISPALADDMPLLHVGQRVSSGFVPPAGSALLLVDGVSNLLLVNGTDNLCLAASSSC